MPAPADLNQTEQVDDLEESAELVSDPAAAEGYGPGEEIHQATISALSDTDLSLAEIEGILFMREEEKLARDVYIYLADMWNMNIFSNISNSENTHMEAVLTLIDLSNLEDPVQENDLGVFANQDLQTLYDDLTTTGSQSLADALLVGGAIEEIDILDLQKYLEQTSNSAVIEVYQNLLRGSINHLNSFVRNYERQTGETYQPQFLSQEEYQEILSLSSDSNPNQARDMGSMNSNGKRAGRMRQ